MRTLAMLLTGLLMGSGALCLSRADEPQPPRARFTEHLIQGGYGYAFGLAAADLDGDGRLDLVSSDATGNALSWLANDGKGSFRRYFIAKDEQGWFERLAVGDVNGDGKPDVVVVKDLHAEIVWFENSGSPRDGKPWKRHVLATKFSRAYDVALADLDGDGRLDVAASAWVGNEFAWFRNPGPGGDGKEWQKIVLDSKVAETRTIRVADFNRDGRSDLLGTATAGNLVVWYENPGDLKRPWKKHVLDDQSPRPTHGHPVDLDGDGDLDVVMALGFNAPAGQKETHQVVWYENVGKPGDGTKWEKHVLGELPGAFEAVAADLNGDGKPDVVATTWGPKGRVVWFENPENPRGKWVMHVLKDDWPRANAVIVADLNGDGRPDIAAVAERGSNELRWWRNEGRPAPKPEVPPETPAEAKRRHERVAERLKGVHIICHRGASEFAHENTLEAYRATFELGGDGNEFDIRTTKDGVLVCFHDDMLDRLLEAYGDVSEFTWDELRRFRFRNPGPFGEQCRIPTLVEVFELHRQHAGLMHLDIKRPGLDRAIADLLDRMDLWDHVAHCNTENGEVILKHPRMKLRRYKASLYGDRSEVFPEAVTAALKKPGDGVIVDDPRGVAMALGRKLGKVSRQPVSPRKVELPAKEEPPAEVALIATLRKAEDWDRVAQNAEEKAASGKRIRDRARAAEQLLAHKTSLKEALAALEERVRRRSLHKDWMYHGFDGAMALRSLILLRAPNAVETARFALWRDDPALEPVIDPRWKNPRAWTDFRVKMVIFPALEQCPGAVTEKLCRDYLALSDEEARKIGPPLFDPAAKALLAVSPKTETALELMKHRLQAVRGRTILECLKHANEPWAKAALEKGAPHALAYRTE